MTIKTATRVLAGSAIGIASVLTMSLPVFAATLNRQLDIGMSGSDVSSLQSFLARDVSIYPQGLVTGYFGGLTSSAVSRFQTRNAIDAVGRVGPVTLVALNAQMDGQISANTFAPTIAPVNVSTSSNTATVSWGTSEAARGVVYYSTSPLATFERTNSVDVSGAVAQTDTMLRTSQTVLISGLQSATNYYYMVYVTDADGNVSVTVPTVFRTL
jgi:peptidoglycan hydrolase-like protein with peptidoglycan-binding domain